METEAHPVDQVVSQFFEGFNYILQVDKSYFKVNVGFGKNINSHSISLL